MRDGNDAIDLALLALFVLGICIVALAAAHA
jgi:hypothetical protein